MSAIEDWHTEHGYMLITSEHRTLDTLVSWLLLCQGQDPVTWA